MTEELVEKAIQAAREEIARQKDADAAPVSAEFVRRGEWDDTSEVRQAIAIAHAVVPVVLEEAAKVAEADNGRTPHGNIDYGPNVPIRIAAAIRQMGSI